MAPAADEKSNAKIPGDLTSSVYLQLREDILAGVFPGDVPLLETSLATRYGISRTPVREALSLLEHDGLVQRAARGFRIRSGSAQDVMEIYEARIALESAASGLAANRRTELDVIQLGHVQERATQADTEPEVRAFQSQWHECVWQAGHNQTIVTTLGRLMAQLHIYDQHMPDAINDVDTSNEEHAEITKAIQSHDSDLARTLMSAHLERSRDLRLKSILVD
ncbi:MAG: GntR family transcriptional regulator [Propionibacteriaceae bacterium]|jgi:DNA-binding GntR family transcriptional regulator|nr:GntR family transcriptional regulator [Propionibacteriaceae bacterium]